MAQQLPPEFATLETWVQDWSLPTQNQRWDKRLASSKEELVAFYDAVLPHLEAILDAADEYPLGEMPDVVSQLFNLSMMLAEIAPNVELYRGEPGVPYSFEERRFIAVQGDAST